MKKIKLTQGKYALVDNEYFEQFNQHKWYAQKKGNNWYAARDIRIGKKHITILMHREILVLKVGDGIQSDHKNGDGLDNRRCNLRRCSVAENVRNQRIQKRLKSSSHKGVTWCQGKWQSQIKHNQTEIYLGRFDSEIDAAKAYDVAATRLFSEFAKLNFPFERATLWQAQ